jgi:hypothetical protein
MGTVLTGEWSRLRPEALRLFRTCGVTRDDITGIPEGSQITCRPGVSALIGLVGIVPSGLCHRYDPMPDQLPSLWR